MSLLFDRTIAVHRLKTVAGSTDSAIGLTGYSGAEESTSPSDPQGETVLYVGIAASIDAGTLGRKKDSALPQDVVYGPTWYIYCSVQLPKYSVRDRDIIVDDEGYRYEVGQAEWGGPWLSVDLRPSGGVMTRALLLVGCVLFIAILLAAEERRRG